MSGADSTISGCARANAGDRRARAPQQHRDAFLGQHPGSLVGQVRGDQAAECAVGLAPRQVEPHRAQDRGLRLGDVDATGDQPPTYGLDQERMDAVAPGLGCGGIRRNPADEQTGRLELGEDLAGPRVAGEMCRLLGGDHDLVRHAEQQVALTGLERREHLAREPVGDARVSLGVATCGRHGVRRCCDGPRREHDRGDPAVGVVDDRPDHLRVVGTRVLGDERGTLLVVHPQDVAAQDREVTHQLRDEPRQGQVPARQQDDPEGLGCVDEPLVEHPLRGDRQLVCVVDDQQV